MSVQDLEKVAQKQMESGMATHLQSGEDAIAVALATTQQMPRVSRDERKKILEQTFMEKLEGLSGVEMDLDTLSISGQTIEARIGIKDIAKLYGRIKKSFDIYPIVRQKMV